MEGRKERGERAEKQESFRGVEEVGSSIRKVNQSKVPLCKEGSIEGCNTCSTRLGGAQEHHSSREAN